MRQTHFDALHLSWYPAPQLRKLRPWFSLLRELGGFAQRLHAQPLSSAVFPPARLALLGRPREFHVETPTTSRTSVESRRVWILAHRSFRPFAGIPFISEAPLNRVAENRPVSPEPPAPLLRERGAIEPDGFGIQPLPYGVGVDCVQLILARA